MLISRLTQLQGWFEFVPSCVSVYEQLQQSTNKAQNLASILPLNGKAKCCLLRVLNGPSDSLFGHMINLLTTFSHRMQGRGQAWNKLPFGLFTLVNAMVSGWHSHRLLSLCQIQVFKKGTDAQLPYDKPIWSRKKCLPLRLPQSCTCKVTWKLIWWPMFAKSTSCRAYSGYTLRSIDIMILVYREVLSRRQAMNDIILHFGVTGMIRQPL